MRDKLEQAARLIYQKVFRRIPALRRPGVTTALQYVQTDAGASEEAYYVTKITRVLAVLAAGAVLIALARAAAVRNIALTKDGALPRAAKGGNKTETTLMAQTEDGAELGAYDVAVEARRYTAAEADALFEEACAQLPALIVGDNDSLDHVTEPLVLISSIKGYPFTVSWSTDNYLRLKSDGTPMTKDVPEEGEVVGLTACFTYIDRTWEYVLYVRVCAPVPDAETLMREEMTDALINAQEETLYEEEMLLPKTYHGRQIIWSEVTEDNTPVLVALVLIVATGIYFAQDGELQSRMKKREAALLAAYPGFVSQMTLYLGAGMTVRGVFLKAAEDYEARRKEGAPVSFLHEELRLAAGELANGMSESVVYEHFARRTRLQEYTKLCALLTQNLKKGPAQLLTLLKAEAMTATRMRMDSARVKGEQAGTKLMLPMMLMLMVVMVLVMIPAYMSF